MFRLNAQIYAVYLTALQQPYSLHEVDALEINGYTIRLRKSDKGVTILYKGAHFFITDVNYSEHVKADGYTARNADHCEVEYLPASDCS